MAYSSEFEEQCGMMIISLLSTDDSLRDQIQLIEETFYKRDNLIINFKEIKSFTSF